MRVVAYSIKNLEKELLAIANRKKHDITLISNALSAETLSYATGKDAVLVFSDDDVSGPIINQLADMGIKYIATRGTETSHIDLVCALQRGVQIANVPNTNSPDDIAEASIANLDKWQAKTCLGNACVCSRSCRDIKDQTEEPKNK